MHHSLQGTYQRVLLSPMNVIESEKLRVLRNQNLEWFCNSSEVSAEQQMAWFQQYLTATNDYMFSVYYYLGEIWIGAVGLYDINFTEKTAQFGRLVLDQKKVMEKGLGLDTTICACNIGFEQLNLNTISLEVFSDNIPAKKTYHRAGFETFGCELFDGDRELIKMKIVSQGLQEGVSEDGFF